MSSVPLYLHDCVMSYLGHSATSCVYVSSSSGHREAALTLPHQSGDMTVASDFAMGYLLNRLVDCSVPQPHFFRPFLGRHSYALLHEEE